MRQEPYASWATALDWMVLAGIWIYLLTYFTPELLLSDTTTTGGDTGSHYYTAWYLVHELWPQGHLSGWVPGNLAGYPLFQLYFPLPFWLMGLLAQVMPLTIAFKLVSVSGAFLLPWGVRLGLRRAGLAFPAPALGAVACLPFLFNETQSMWGGNLPSLLAGEMGYSLGLAFLAVYLGSLQRDMDQGRRVAGNAFWLALVGLSHGCALLVGGLAGGLWLFNQKMPARLVYLLKVYALAFALMALWLAPVLVHGSYTTVHNAAWEIDDWRKVLPPLISPLMALAGLHGLWLLGGGERTNGQGRAAAWFLGLAGLSGVLYLVAYPLNVIDIRFVPFIWLAFCVWAGVALGAWSQNLAGRGLVPLTALLLAVAGVGWQVDYIPRWIAWNYRGFEHAPGWGDFDRLCSRLKGGPGDPRVLHEHADVHNRLGTTRAFENLPLFAGRNTLEGLYLQSSISSPFVFYLQSLTSQTPTTPLAEYVYGGFDLARALPRMRLFNVGSFVVVDPRTRRAARAQKGLDEQGTVGPYSIFKVAGNAGAYAVPLAFKPVLVITRRWRELAYAWFRSGDLEVPLVFSRQGPKPGQRHLFAAVWEDRLDQAPRVPVANQGPLQERVENQRLEISNPALAPLLIKVSYHPNWRVRGARQVYLASPSFMLVFPREETVVLEWTPGWPAHLGLGLTILGLVVLALAWPGVADRGPVARVRAWGGAPGRALERGLTRLAARPLAMAGRHPLGWGLVAGLLAVGGLVLFVYLGGRQDPAGAWRRAGAALAARDYDQALTLSQRILERWPASLVADGAALYRAQALYEQKKWASAGEAFKYLLEKYPDSSRAPQAAHYLAACWQAQGQEDQARAALKYLVEYYPHSPWAAGARRELALSPEP